MRILFCILIGIAVCVSCNRLDDPDFTHDLNISFDVPVALNTQETHYFQVPNVPTFLDLSLDPFALDYDDVESITSQSCRIAATGGTLDLDFIHRIIVNAYTEDETTELFYLENIQFGNKTDIQLLASIPELKEVLAQEFVNLEVGMRFRQFPPANFTCQAQMKFSVYTNE